MQKSLINLRQEFFELPLPSQIAYALAYTDSSTSRVLYDKDETGICRGCSGWLAEMAVLHIFRVADSHSDGPEMGCIPRKCDHDFKPGWSW